MSLAESHQSPSLTSHTLARIARQIYQIAGIQLQDEKVALVEARLSKRLRALNLKSYEDYCDLLEQGDEAHEKQELLSALTTNVTKFFREKHHFDFLTENKLGELMEKAQKGRPVRIWSAGCSSGEEPYSIAMTILKKYPRAKDLDVKILATDIDPQILSVARKGVYSRELLSGLPQPTLTNFFGSAAEGRSLEIAPSVRNMVTFNALNLHEKWPLKTQFDVIFCRNVTIYFSKEDEKKVWKKFCDQLHVGGLIFVGHSERIPPSTAPELELCSITTYRKSAK